MLFERLSRQITLQKMGIVTNPLSGDTHKAVLESHVVWAEYKALHGSERYEGMMERSRGNISFIIRFMPSIRASEWRVLDDVGRIWEIVGEPREIGRRAGLDLLCERMESSGVS
jgi:SPP1 family predicted phage head-tail adaptor